MLASDPLVLRLRNTASAQLAAMHGRTVVVGLSGGADSVALLFLLHQARDHLGIDLHAAHFDHRLRPGSEREASALRGWTESIGVSLCEGSANVSAVARDLGLSLEAAARVARYGFLADTARSLNAMVVVAHNQNDQAETVLLNLARGAGITGAAGMRPVTTVPSAPDIPLVRPFLSVGADEIRAVCARNELPIIEDPSNHSPEFARNRVRDDVLPSLVGVNAAAVRNIANAAEALRSDEEALETLGVELYGRAMEVYGTYMYVDLPAFRSAPHAVQLRALRLAARHLAGSLDGFERVHLLALVALAHGDVGGRTLHLPTGLRASRMAEQIVLWTGDLPEHAVYALPLLEGTDDAPARLTPAWMWSASHGQCGSPSEKSGTRFHEHVRYTEEALVLRAARPGETFQPLGMSTGKRVGDFLADRKVPPFVRPRVPLVTVGDEPAWLMGWRIDDRWKVLRQDAPIVCLRCTRAGPSREGLHI